MMGWQCLELSVIVYKFYMIKKNSICIQRLSNPVLFLPGISLQGDSRLVEGEVRSSMKMKLSETENKDYHCNREKPDRLRFQQFTRSNV